MPAISTAYAKNIIRRAFAELVDPSPDQKKLDTLWQHFESSCAYCGLALRRNQKEAHIDHLVSASKGGANHISNRVLSCARCNEVEKRDLPWREFLKMKCEDEGVVERRERRIGVWQMLNESAEVGHESLMESAECFANEIIMLFDRHVRAIKAAKTKR